MQNALERRVELGVSDVLELPARRPEEKTRLYVTVVLL